MKQTYKCLLREYLTRCFQETRKEYGFTQEVFSEKLMMDIRSYASLEHGEHMCCTLTLIIYLCFFCKNPESVIQDFRTILQNYTYKGRKKPIS